MDSSDILRKKQAQTVYGFYKNTLFSTAELNTITAATSPNLTLTNHGLRVGDAIVFGRIGAGFLWSVTPALNTLFYIVAVTANTFQFSATLNGSATTWSGTITQFPTFYGPASFITKSLSCASLAGCVVNYPSYEERQKVVTGSQICNSCSKIGCGCSA